MQDLFEQTFQSDRIYVAMQKLDEMYKDVIFCKYIQEYSHKEIAEYLQISEENVRQRLSR
ncbi:sigma-70 family RNA polymerase sigma factor [Patescibacteria group bacterium]|nr:sigma-70 family RNA polymerase sigma factor [Patescibacteria group bacterium]